MGTFTHFIAVIDTVKQINIMRNKIVSITEKVPAPSTLPDGYYQGTWGGYVIEVRYNGKAYDLRTEDGVRGVGINVVVHVENGVATFDDLNK